MSDPRFQIVLVEDSEPDVFLVREALEQGGLQFELHVLEDGEKALEFIDWIEGDTAARCPHLILLDLNLPRVSGAQVLERVRQSSKCGSIPVVILTSSDYHKDKAEVARLGATQYFRKSSRLEEFMKLGSVVRGLLNESPSLRASGL